MAYNVKITEYANGQLEVITYKQAIKQNCQRGYKKL